MDRDVVRRLLGHSTPAMVDRVYGRPRAAALGELAERAIERSQFVAKPTPREHCTPGNGVAKCSTSLTRDNTDDPCDGFLIHWSRVRIPVDPPEFVVSPRTLSLKRSVDPGFGRMALLYAAERMGCAL